MGLLGPWKEGATLTSAVSGTSIGAVSYEDPNSIFRSTTYQATGLSNREYCWDSGTTWVPGAYIMFSPLAD